MQKDLLSIVQYILSALDSDEVSDINDTVESRQIVVMAEQLFYDIAVDLNLNEHKGMIEINASLLPSTPCTMTIPSKVSDVEWIKYDNQVFGDTTPVFEPVQFMEFHEFLNMTQAMRNEDPLLVGSQPIVMNGETTQFMYRKDRAPQWFTTLDGTQLIFDSIDLGVDTTLQKSKTLVYGTKYPDFILSNTFVPDFDPAQFPFFLNKLKVRAFAELKQTTNTEAKEQARRLRVVAQPRRDRTAGLTFFQRVPKYGRK